MENLSIQIPKATSFLITIDCASTSNRGICGEHQVRSPGTIKITSGFYYETHHVIKDQNKQGMIKFITNSFIKSILKRYTEPFRVKKHSTQCFKKKKLKITSVYFIFLITFTVCPAKIRVELMF